MKGGDRRLWWIPPFLLGGAGATAAELAAGLLLYSTGGFLRSLTVVLAVELLALGLGFASSRTMTSGDLRALRRRWLATLFAFAGGAGFSAAWSLGGGFSAAGPAQALGLALMGGFPLFATGAALGALGTVGGDRVGAPALFGGAAGVIATGLLGVPNLQPTSLFLFCVVAVSVGALVHGWLTDRRIVVRVVSEDRGPGSGPILRLEERIRGDVARRGRVLTVSGRPESGRGAGNEALLPWERAAELFLREYRPPCTVLVVGVGTGGFRERLWPGSDGDGIVAVEPWERVRRMELEEARGETVPRRDIPRVLPPSDLRASFDVVVVNLPLLPGGGPGPGEGLEVLEAAGAARAPGGTLILGGIELDPDDGSAFRRWLRSRPWSPRSLDLFVPGGSGSNSASPLIPSESDRRDRGGGLLLGTAAEALPAGAADAMEVAGMEAVP